MNIQQTKFSIHSPLDLETLKKRVAAINNKSLAEIATALNITAPLNLKIAKGWIGQLIEQALGATAGSKAIHDFPELKIEMKTIPVNHAFQSIESTYICTAPINADLTSWEESWICRKLQHVLWIPIEYNQQLSLINRRIKNPFFWQPTSEQQAMLKQDWEELMELLQTGGIAKLSAKYGTHLHIRPKAANSKVLVAAVDEYGNVFKTVPKGFYLRTSFTRALLASTAK